MLVFISCDLCVQIYYKNYPENIFNIYIIIELNYNLEPFHVNSLI